ncbi:MAG: fumarylacetoacetate hydrolase family protein [Verrucomicrobiales bacterium]|nr:fumarylacetoacetate hydrolase family protein [Verrucomicrobiales bacterium]
MRLCRFSENSTPDTIQIGLFEDNAVRPFAEPPSTDLLDFLPGGGHADWANSLADLPSLPVESVTLHVPNPEPKKLFLLAGNYAAHIEEGGGIAAERAETFPYVFMKPPTTTLIGAGAPVKIPAVSPDHIDWELELGVVIGKGGKGISEADALDHVAGYTVFNDISDRQFRPNPNRTERSRDGFFDWLHGKWHDSSCPCGPCIASAETLTEPQCLDMKLSVNGEIFQEASTAQQIFPVAAVIEFISSFVTLERGDMISTGTAAGVGATTATYLKSGDKIEATIESIGTLVSPVE